MLPYLEALCAALIARDRSAVGELVANAHASDLPPEVRAEVEACLAGNGPRAPLRTLHFYYQQVQRTLVVSSLSAAMDRSSRGSRAVQIELPLSAA